MRRIVSALAVVGLLCTQTMGFLSRHPLFVPYPRGLQLLAVVEGRAHGVPFARPLPGRDEWNGLVLVRFPRSLDLVNRAQGAVNEVHARLWMMRSLAQYAAYAATEEERVLLDEEFQDELQDLEALVSETRFQGTLLLDGDTVGLEARGESEPVLLTLPDASPQTLGLSGVGFDLLTPDNAMLAARKVGGVLYRFRQHRVELFAIEAKLGTPDASGLRGVELSLGRMRDLATRAADGTQNTGDRVVLDIGFQDQLATIERVAASTTFSGVPVLDGSTDAILEGPPPAGMPIYIDLADVTAEGLDLVVADSSFELTTATNAYMALTRVETAIATVRDARQDVQEARQRLLGGGARPR